MKKLFNRINQYATLSDDSLEKFQSILKIKHYKKGDYLCKFGEMPKNAYFLLEGYVRGYALTSKGTHYNRALYKSIDFMASLTALTQKKKANLALECLTDCKVVYANWDEFIELTNTDTDMGIFYRKFLELFFINMELSNIQLVTMTATERYLNLRKRYPKVENHISQHHIASFIGVTPIQLSRIRKKLFFS